MDASAPTTGLPARIVLEDAAQASSLAYMGCVARGELSVSVGVLGCDLEVFGELHAAAAYIVDSKLRLCAESKVGEVQAKATSATTLHLFAVAGNWYEVRQRAQTILTDKRQQLDQHQFVLNQLREREGDLTHEERERVMAAEFEVPDLETVVKQLTKKVSQLDEVIEQRRFHNVVFSQGLCPGVEIRIADAPVRYCVVDRIADAVTLKYVGENTAVFTMQGSAELPLAQHPSVRILVG